MKKIGLKIPGKVRCTITSSILSELELLPLSQTDYTYFAALEN